MFLSRHVSKKMAKIRQWSGYNLRRGHFVDEIRDIFQDSNLNFLIGSGLSSPFLRTLGNIEVLLTDLADASCPEDEKKIIRCSLYKQYFDGVIVRNPDILALAEDALTVLNNYKTFLKTINSILLSRKSTILGKEANLFTTNLDVFIEKSIEDLGLECNDGFNGRFLPSFNLTNFKKSHFKRSLHYDNKSELPVFNLLKLHGSLTWKLRTADTIVFSSDLKQVSEIGACVCSPSMLVDVSGTSRLDALLSAARGRRADPALDKFMSAYDKLLIVNPTKEKFKQSLLNQTYYELLRIYSNELEKENTTLFVMGFSFGDQHIRDVTLRAANSNPTLMIYVVAHSTQAQKEIEDRLGIDHLKNDNVRTISPPTKDGKDSFAYDLETINREIFSKQFANEITDNPTSPTAEVPA